MTLNEVKVNEASALSELDKDDEKYKELTTRKSDKKELKGKYNVARPAPGESTYTELKSDEL